MAPKFGGITLRSGKLLTVDGQLAGTPSALFDAVALVLSDEGCAALLKDSAAIDFVSNVFVHLEAIRFTAQAQPLLDKADVAPDAGVVDLAAGAYASFPRQAPVSGTASRRSARWHRHAIMNGDHGDAGAQKGRHPPSRAAGPGDGLADHEATAVETVARLRAAHEERSTLLQRAVDIPTDFLGRPAAAVSMLLAFGAWTVLAAWRSHGRLDEPMAGWLELAATLAALLTAILIFSSQRRSDLLAERRAELTLQLALLADAKNARIIKLMQELRRDLPSVTDRLDAEADEMATPVDPGAVLDAMEKLSPEPKS